MIRHVVMFRFKQEATDAQKRAIAENLTRLPGKIDVIRRYEFGPDAGLSEGNFDFTVVADFDSEDDYRSYAAHPDHQALIADHIRPVLAERSAVQYRIP